MRFGREPKNGIAWRVVNAHNLLSGINTRIMPELNRKPPDAATLFCVS
jgi:hypothetical protein